ncbi:hypothetical protein A2U01_0079093, partial [Trifolium medium]|nr:hypothetical protein [Trifolium medium]
STERMSAPVEGHRGGGLTRRQWPLVKVSDGGLFDRIG